MNIDTKVLISEVEKRPHIWNPSHPDYRLREARIESWKEICSKLVENFDAMDSEVQDEIMNRARTRWKTARDSYIKIENKHKTLGTTKNINNYNYLEQLQFIKQINRKKSRSEYDRENPTEDESSQDDGLAMFKQEELNIKSEDNRNVTTKNTMMSCEPSTVSNYDEDDRNFLISMLPTLKKFDDDQKLTFRLEMLQLMMQLKNTPSPALP